MEFDKYIHHHLKNRSSANLPTFVAKISGNIVPEVESTTEDAHLFNALFHIPKDTGFGQAHARNHLGGLVSDFLKTGSPSRPGFLRGKTCIFSKRSRETALGFQFHFTYGHPGAQSTTIGSASHFLRNARFGREDKRSDIGAQNWASSNQQQCTRTVPSAGDWTLRS